MSSVRPLIFDLKLVLFLCVFGLLTPPLTHGQGFFYLSNTNQAVTASGLTGSFGVGFTTGTNTSGYLLNSLTVLFANNNTPVLTSAKLAENSTTTFFQDAVEVGAAGYYTFTPNSPLPLAANTTYSLLVYPDDAQVEANLSYTTSSAFSGFDNWNIPGLNGSDEPLFAISATPVASAPEPSVTSLIWTCGSIFIAVGIRRRGLNRKTKS